MIAVVLVGTIAGLFSYQLYKKRWKKPKQEFNEQWRVILTNQIPFYNTLNTKDKRHFEFKVQEFILNMNFTGVHVEVTDEDKLLIASSAIIPIFNFKDWRYNNLDEIILYPNAFNKDFEITGPDRRILGMVGYGFMEGKMILSREALHHGFKNETDKHNTAIHEFIHLVDKADGQIDGIPAVLLEKQYVLPWMQMVMDKITEIRKREHKDINPYGATNQAEFLAVIGTYFFERPKLLKRKHPELYKLLCEIFDTKP